MIEKLNVDNCSSFDKGSLGIYHVKRFWEKSAGVAKGLNKHSNDEWNLDLIIIDKLNLGIEEAIGKVYEYVDSFDEFEKWIVNKNNGYISPEKISNINSTIESLVNSETAPELSVKEFGELILNEGDMDFWNTNGYIVLKKAVSEEDCIAAENAIWDFLELDSSDPETWYKSNSKQQGIMVQLFDHPALQVTRENSTIRMAFEQLWNSRNLIVSHDRVSFNPPENSKWQFPGPRLHWDASLALPIPLGLQGLLYLTDTDAEQGAFTCVPGFQNRVDEWLGSLEDGKNPRTQNLDDLGAVPISGKRGDFVLWHHALPHGSRSNKTDKPRIVQYIKWYPPDLVDKREWI